VRRPRRHSPGCAHHLFLFVADHHLFARHHFARHDLADCVATFDPGGGGGAP
jgi:hypothetical protein